jgi:hypothetical protein
VRAAWFTSCKQKWYMDLPGSACAPRFTYISTAFGCHTISSDYQSRTVWTLTLREHIIGGSRDLDILTPHEAHHSSRIMRTYHTHFGVPLGNTSGWWDDRKRNQKPVLPLYLRLGIPSNLSRALSCLRLSGHNFLVQRMRHDRNRRPYEIKICDRCDWHTIQDEEHILLDCPHEHLVRLRTQQQLIFPPQFEDGPARLRTLMNQPDIFGVASFVAKCLALFPWFF